jgi:molybdopterin-synthase adenylyltransferase
MLKDRYKKNGQTITAGENVILKEKKVLVAGCGGLGGHIIEMLARAGVGHITAVDPDVFDETNLNRQLLCEERLLGKSKAEAAINRISNVNSEVTVTPVQERVTSENAKKLFQGHDLIIDALDNIPSRFDIQDAAEKCNIPIVHGAIAGWYGQVSVLFPGDKFFDKIYPEREKTVVDTSSGNPSFSPAVTAGFQVGESIKYLLGKGTLLRGQMLFIDMLNNQFELIDI